MTSKDETFAKWSRREEKKCGIPHSASREKRFFSISLLTCENKRAFFKFPFPQEKKSRKNEFLPIKMNKISDFCGKGRDFLPTSHCGKRFFSISLPPWGKGNFFGGFPFPHVGRKEIVFPFSFLTVTIRKCFVIYFNRC